MPQNNDISPRRGMGTRTISRSGGLAWLDSDGADANGGGGEQRIWSDFWGADVSSLGSLGRTKPFPLEPTFSLSASHGLAYFFLRDRSYKVTFSDKNLTPDFPPLSIASRNIRSLNPDAKRYRKKILFFFCADCRRANAAPTKTLGNSITTCAGFIPLRLHNCGCDVDSRIVRLFLFLTSPLIDTSCTVNYAS